MQNAADGMDEKLVKIERIEANSATSQDGSDGNTEQVREGWQLPLQAVICEHCDWSYLLPAGSLPQQCPHCFQAGLTPFAASKAAITDQHWRQDSPPEALIPFSLSTPALTGGIEAFASGIPFAPLDLAPGNLQSRMRRLYLPMWLVDAEIQASWQAEMGFDCKVVSHQDRYDDRRGGWSSQEVSEGRIRWEPRLGKLARKYDNVIAPALESDAKIKQRLGSFELDKIGPYKVEAMAKSFIRIPDRSPQDAWSEARPAFQAAAAEECRQATDANHIRQFSWQAEFQNQNWSLLLLPVATTYYLDDERKPQPVLVHGQTGKVSGVRQASMKRGKKASLSILVAAVVIFLVSLALTLAGALLPVVLIFGVIGLAVSLALALGAVYPVAAVWWFNRNQQPSRSTPGMKDAKDLPS